MMHVRTLALLAALATLTTALQAAPTATAQPDGTCPETDVLFPGPTRVAHLRYGAVYEGLSRWYVHDAGTPGERTYQLVPTIGDADLRVWDERCPDDPLCESTQPARHVDVCTARGRTLVVEVHGDHAPAAPLGVHYAIRADG